MISDSILQLVRLVVSFRCWFVKKYCWLVCVREKYCSGWKFMIIYDEPQPNEQAASNVYCVYSTYHTCKIQSSQCCCARKTHPRHGNCSQCCLHFNSAGSGCINPDHLTRRPVKKKLQANAVQSTNPAAKLGSNLMLMYAMSSHACRRQFFSTCSVDRCCCEYITMDMLPTEHEVSI